MPLPCDVPGQRVLKLYPAGNQERCSLMNWVEFSVVFLTDFVNLFFFCSSSSGCCSPQTNEHSRPHWLLTAVQQSETVQSETSISCLAGPQDDAGPEEKEAQRRRLLALTRTAVNVGGSVRMTPVVTRGPGCARPDQTSPDSGTGRCSPLHARSEPSVRRSQLTLCLPSCLRPDDRC